jgi:hypothetical protein
MYSKLTLALLYSLRQTSYLLDLYKCAVNKLMGNYQYLPLNLILLDIVDSFGCDDKHSLLDPIKHVDLLYLV